MDNDVMPRQPLSFAALCALPGAVVTRDEARGIVTVMFRGRYAGQGDLTADEVDEMMVKSFDLYSEREKIRSILSMWDQERQNHERIG